MTSSDWVDERFRMADPPSVNVWGRPRLAQTNLPYGPHFELMVFRRYRVEWLV